MPTIERSTLVDAAPDVVWAVIADPTRAGEWMPDVKARRPLQAGPLAVGARWSEAGLLRGRSYEAIYEVTAWEPPARLAYRRADAESRRFAWEESVHIEPAGAGSRVTLALHYALPRGIIGRLYDRLLFRRDFAATLDNRLDALKSLLQP
jgi:uncharacterized protein YndB with AHSA1/START domain